MQYCKSCDIAHEERECPLCDAKEEIIELEKEIIKKESEIEELEKTIEKS